MPRAPSPAPSYAVIPGASVGLITKTEVNPFFVTMRNAATAKAAELGVPFQACAGASDSDTPGQITCIENQVAAGVTTILLTPGDPLALADTVTKVREGGVKVIALDTQMNPTNVADATLATDNFQAGLFIGEWAKGTLGDKAADAVVALLDVSDGKQITTEVQRDQGFMQGFGIADIGDPTKLYDENDPRIAGYAATDGNQDLGRTAMENLLAKNPKINLVYTINEPAAAGAYEAIQAAALDHDGADRLGRRRLPGRPERQGRQDRGDLDAVPAAHGGAGRHRWGHRCPAGAHRGPRVHEHRCRAHHRSPGRGRRVPEHRLGPPELLGLARAQARRMRTGWPEWPPRSRIGPAPAGR